jgi:hypothetical protein
MRDLIELISETSRLAAAPVAVVGRNGYVALVSWGNNPGFR